MKATKKKPLINMPPKYKHTQGGGYSPGNAHKIINPAVAA